MNREGRGESIEQGPDLLQDLAGQVDEKLEEDGAWFGHALEEKEPKSDEIEGYRHLLVDKNGNGLLRAKVRSRYTSAYRAAEDRRTARMLRLSVDKRVRRNRAMLEELTAKFCLVDWELTDREGTPIPISNALKMRILTEPKFRNHKFFINECIAKLQGDMEDAEEEDRGNS